MRASTSQNARPAARASCRVRASSAASPMVRGNNRRNAATRSSSNDICGGSWNSTGRSFSPSRRTPAAKKFASGVSQSRRRFMRVMKRLAFSENTKLGVVSRTQRVHADRCRSEWNEPFTSTVGITSLTYESSRFCVSRRIEDATPRRIFPSRYADEDAPHRGLTSSRPRSRDCGHEATHQATRVPRTAFAPTRSARRDALCSCRTRRQKRRGTRVRLPKHVARRLGCDA